MKTETMEHNTDRIVAFFAGMFGGIVKLITGSVLLDVSFMGKLAEAGVTALVCGFLGVAGKHLFSFAWKKITNKNKKS